MSVRILVGGALQRLRQLPSESVDCCVTSPPYWGLRDYGVRGQIGQEPTPDAYVATLVEVFGQVKRVLQNDGTLWLNIGDSYSGSRGGKQGATGQMADRSVTVARAQARKGTLSAPGIREKNLVGVPWMLAFALRADGWYLRSDIIWSKPNPMPESVTDRPTRSHEYVFMLTKSERYFYDAEAIAEPLAASSVARLAQDVEQQSGSGRANGGTRSHRPMKAGVRTSGNKARKLRGDFGGVQDSSSAHRGFAIPWAADGSHRPQYQRALQLAREGGLTVEHLDAIRVCGFFGDPKTKTAATNNGTGNIEALALAAEAKRVLGGYYREFLQRPTRNRRSVWSIATKPYRGAHFATMPPELAETCILAGSRAGGMVLDPFGGAGTTGLVANRHGRNALLIEINPDYARLARERIDSDGPLLAEVAAG